MTNVSLNVSCSTKYELVTRAGAEDLEILTRDTWRAEQRSGVTVTITLLQPPPAPLIHSEVLASLLSRPPSETPLTQRYRDDPFLNTQLRVQNCNIYQFIWKINYFRLDAESSIYLCPSAGRESEDLFCKKTIGSTPQNNIIIHHSD